VEEALTPERKEAGGERSIIEVTLSELRGLKQERRRKKASSPHQREIKLGKAEVTLA